MSISDATWEEFDKWNRGRDRNDPSLPSNWVAVPAGFATYKRIKTREWERIHKYDHLLKAAVKPREILPDEIEVEYDPLAVSDE